MEALSGVKGDNSVKIFGPDLDELETLAEKVKNILQDIPGIENVGIFHIRGSRTWSSASTRRSARSGACTTADVNNVVSSAVGGKAMSSMVEGEKLFDIALRWPKWRRSSETVDPRHPGGHHQQPGGPGTGLGLHAQRQRACPASARGHPAAWPTRPTRSAARRGSGCATWSRRSATDGAPDPNGQFDRPGASTIYREQGKRLIAIKFSVRGRDLGSAVAEAQARDQGPLPDRPTGRSGAASSRRWRRPNGRLMLIIPLVAGP